MTPFSTVHFPARAPLDELRILYGDVTGTPAPNPGIRLHACWVVEGFALSLGGTPGLSGSGDITAALAKTIDPAPVPLTAGEVNLLLAHAQSGLKGDPA